MMTPPHTHTHARGTYTHTHNLKTFAPKSFQIITSPCPHLQALFMAGPLFSGAAVGVGGDLTPVLSPADMHPQQLRENRTLRCFARLLPPSSISFSCCLQGLDYRQNITSVTLNTCLLRNLAIKIIRFNECRSKSPADSGCRSDAVIVFVHGRLLIRLCHFVSSFCL